jgi:hypothetical protein
MKNQMARLEAVETHLAGGDVRLTMPDGSARTVSSRHWLDMMQELGQGIVAEDTKAVIESVSDDCLATGNGRMCEVIKTMAFGAAQVEAGDSIEGTIQVTELDSEGNGGLIQ